jgi:membrane protein
MSMKIFGQNQFWTLSGAALLAALVIFAADRQAAQQNARRSRSPQDLATVTARAPADEPLAVQEARAAQRGRGRNAQSPFAFPWKGWKDILLRTWTGIADDHLLALAGGIAFYALLALFPALTAGVSFYALFADPQSIQGQLSLLSNVVPSAAIDIIRNQIISIATKSNSGLTLGFLGGLALSLWSANAGIKACFEALNVVYAEEEKRTLIRLNALTLGLTACGIAAALLAVGAVVVVPLALSIIGFPDSNLVLIAYLRWPAMLLVAMAGFGVLFRFGPSRFPAKSRWITLGSLVAAGVWLVMSVAYSWYLGHVANYTATYGALGAVIGLMMWMWLSATVMLVCAKLNAEIEHQTAIDTTIGPPKALGDRGALMADTVGKAVA